jgi:hypothetical protein
LKELELKNREEALEFKQLKIEQDEKKLGLSGKNTRAVHILELIDQLTKDEVTAVKSAHAGFL